MFMSPAEIVQHYQPLDADREDAPRAYEYTNRPMTTAGTPNETMYTAQGKQHRRPPELESDAQLWHRKRAESQMSPGEYHEAREGTRAKTPQNLDYDSLMEHSSYPTPPSTESTSAWDEYQYREQSHLERKHGEMVHLHDQQFSGPSIHESVRRTGVQQPVHLGQEAGSHGLPQIVGGHHRIAAALDTRPHGLIPVMHHEDIVEAKRMGSYT